jgi:AraC-like DNA-binding protein
VTRPSLIIIYACASIFLLIKYRQKERKNLTSNKQNKLVYNWLLTLIFVTLFVAANFLIMTIKLYMAPVNKVVLESVLAYNISGIAYAILPLALIVFFPKILYGIPIATFAVKAKKTNLVDVGDPLTETAKVIEAYIQKEKPYLYPDFALEDIEEALDIPKHHITYCFAYILNKKFTAYRSWIRVEHAKELLKGGSADSLSIDGIGSQSGFPSRSSFYATFKAETGMTPSQFLENLA